MPLYDYKCAKCGKVFEVEHRPKDVPMKHCPSCGSKLKRVYNPAGVVFKGSGFHITDYRKSEGKSEAKPDKGTKSSKS